MTKSPNQGAMNLLPCPHCGEGNSKVECYKNDYGMWSVGCGACGSHSGNHRNRSAVIDNWNTRAVNQSALLDRAMVALRYVYNAHRSTITPSVTNEIEALLREYENGSGA